MVANGDGVALGEGVAAGVGLGAGVGVGAPAFVKLNTCITVPPTAIYCAVKVVGVIVNRTAPKCVASCQMLPVMQPVAHTA